MQNERPTDVIKKVLITLSILLNIGVAALVTGAANGYIPPALLNLMAEPNHQRWLSQFEALPLDPGDVVFLGDSITWGGSWHELFPDSAVKNRGIGGDTSAGVLARLDQIVAGKPSQLFLLIGTNDPMIGVSQDTIVDNIVTIVARVNDKSPGTQVFVQSLLPRSAGYRERIEALNSRLQATVADQAVWIDLYPLMLDADGSIADKYSNDELHLHGAGYQVWSETIRHLIRSTP